MVKDNLEYWEISKNNPEKILDKYYRFNEEAIPKNSQLYNELTSADQKLQKLIENFDIQYKNGSRLGSEKIDNIVDDVASLLMFCKSKRIKINYSPFCQYFMVHNSSYDEFVKYSETEKKEFLYEILKYYCKERYPIYNSFGYSVVSLQVVSDFHSHKRKGTAQIKKIISMLSPYNLTEISDKTCSDYTWTINNNDYYLLPDKTGKQLFNFLLDELDLDMKSRKGDIKNPDFLFKHNDNYYIFELKSVKGSGGGQNQSIGELTRFIKNQENNRQIHYCGFIDASYANTLFSSDAPKTKKQRKSLYDSLSKAQNNYFVNTEGARCMFEDIFS